MSAARRVPIETRTLPVVRTLTVFCGSSDGVDPRWRATAYDLGAAMAGAGVRLVYGAGGRGLMGAVADGALEAGGEVVGVIPHFMVEREWGRHDLTELVVVDTMHERKAVMCERADAIIALPGGLGTLEELVEIWSWVTLGVLRTPLGLLDRAFWTPFLGTIDHLTAAGFMHPQTREQLVVVDTVDEALARLLP